MIEWFLKFFTTKDKIRYNMPKCSKCGLKSNKKYRIEIIDEDIILTGDICDSCIEDLRRDYDRMWLPPLIIKEE